MLAGYDQMQVKNERAHQCVLEKSVTAEFFGNSRKYQQRAALIIDGEFRHYRLMGNPKEMAISSITSWYFQ